MNLDQLPALLKRLSEVDGLLKRLEDHEARYRAIETGLMEQSAAIAETVEMQSKQLDLLTKLVAMKEAEDKGEKEDDKDEMAPLVEAIKSLKFPQPAPAQSDWTRLQVSIPQGEGRPARTMTITKSK